ncbi:MAG: tail fiber protein, partial [Saprospiraceae bacterium]
QALFSLLGTTYGGDGRVNFALPDLRGRTPIHFGNSVTLGERGGEEAHTLSINEIPTHLHAAQAVAPTTSGTNVNNPNGVFLSNSAPAQIYNAGANQSLTALIGSTLATVGGSQAHQNMQPSLTLSFGIALQGIFPSQN